MICNSTVGFFSFCQIVFRYIALQGGSFGLLNYYFYRVKRKTKSHLVRTFLLAIPFAVISMLVDTTAYAQLEFSNSIDLGFPVLLNKYNQNLYYKQLALGMRFGISYKPNATQFYPTLDFSFGRTRLPLVQFQQNVAALNFNYLNLMLKGNFVMNVFGENTLFLNMGIGFDRLKQKGPAITGKDAGQMKIFEDSAVNVTKIFPCVGVGLEYVYGESVGRPIFLSVGVNVRATLLFDGNNTYYVSGTNAQGNNFYEQGSLTGRVFTPDFHITLHYRPGEEVFFWKKKN